MSSSNQKRTCSWSSVAVVASIVTLVSVVHLFLYPIVPSFDYLRQFQNSCIPINTSNSSSHNNIISTEGSKINLGTSPSPIIDLDAKFPVDSHNAVVYRGAPWKEEVGRWLAGCDSNASAVKVVEVHT